jgi:hypothetical protein
MKTEDQQLTIDGVPAYVSSWSAASLPGFVPAVLDRWRRNYGELPSRFAVVLCPQVEVRAMGGLPDRVRELTDARVRFLHFTGCHKPYVVLFHTGEDADSWRKEVQSQLSWSESYLAELADGVTRLRFVDAVEERDDLPGAEDE